MLSVSEGSSSSQSGALTILSHSRSLTVLRLHGNLDICINEAKNLPNINILQKASEHLFGRLTGKVGHLQGKISSDPYVTVTINEAIIARTFVNSNTQNPLWVQRFCVPVAHRAAQLHFNLKFNVDFAGSNVIGTVDIPVEVLCSGELYEGTFPVLTQNGRPRKEGTMLILSIKYIPIEQMEIYKQGVGVGPPFIGVPGTYFPLRKGGQVTLYQDAHVADNSLPAVKLEEKMKYHHNKCWEDIYDAISNARHLVYITGWSVNHWVDLVRDPEKPSSLNLAELLKKNSEEGVRVLLLVWDDISSRNFLGHDYKGKMNTGDEETRKYFKHSSVHVLLCSRGASKKHDFIKRGEAKATYTHHQKTVIVDVDAGNDMRKIIAFVGGLDLCKGRYDTPEHSLFRTLKTVHSNDFENSNFKGVADVCPRQPWHDLHSKIDGPAAYDVLTNFEERWSKSSIRTHLHKFRSSLEDKLLSVKDIPNVHKMGDAPFLHEDHPEGWHIQVFRSIDSNSVNGFPEDPREAAKKNLATGKHVLIDMSIHTAYVKAIRSAQHYIYIENQYFVGSSFNWNTDIMHGADNLIPLEIALKISNKIRAGERFSAYILIPMWPEGDPCGHSMQRILYFQYQTMSMMYEIVYKALQEMGLDKEFEPQDYLMFFCLGNREKAGPGEYTEYCHAAHSPQGLATKNRRFMIYVHSKGMIVDDEYVILGSANINQRSMEGSRDTEIAMGAYQPKHTWAHKGSYPRGQVHGYRMSLWLEHTGVIKKCYRQPESLKCIKQMRKLGEENWKQYASDEVTDMHSHLLKYPVKIDEFGKVSPLPGCETFPDMGGNITGTYLSIKDNLTT